VQQKKREKKEKQERKKKNEEQLKKDVARLRTRTDHAQGVVHAIADEPFKKLIRGQQGQVADVLEPHRLILRRSHEPKLLKLVRVEYGAPRLPKKKKTKSGEKRAKRGKT
jgi:hypothetical protein